VQLANKLSRDLQRGMGKGASFGEAVTALVLCVHQTLEVVERKHGVLQRDTLRQAIIADINNDAFKQHIVEK